MCRTQKILPSDLITGAGRYHNTIRASSASGERDGGKEEEPTTLTINTKKEQSRQKEKRRRGEIRAF